MQKETTISGLLIKMAIQSITTETMIRGAMTSILRILTVAIKKINIKNSASLIP